MADANTTTTLDGLFKTVYGDSQINMLPDFAILSRKVRFSPSEKIGQRYEVPVKLQYEGGFSYGASGDGAFTLNSAIAGKIARAQVDASQIVLRSQLDYESAFKAASGGKQAFQDATQALVENMMESFAKRQELSMLYGQRGLGTVLTNTSGALVISDATWSPGIWVGMKDAVLEAFTTVADSATQHNGDLTISAVDLASKTVTVTGTSGAVVAGDILFFKGARTTTAHKDMVGLDKILVNTGSLFNISAASYELWKATSYDCAGAVSMEKALNAAAQAVPLGLKEKSMLALAAKRWAKLNNDLSALRRADSSYDSAKFENGVDGITYHGVSGDIEIVSHPFVKEGEGLLVPEKRLKRVGSTDVTFRRPGNANNIFRELESSAGFELRAYSDQQIFCETPSYCVKLTGITD